MALGAIVATQLTTPATRHLSVWIGQRDVNALILWQSLEIEDAAGAAQGTFSCTLNESLANLEEVGVRSFVRVYDHDADAEVFRGFVTGRKPSLVPGYTSTSVRATDHGELLDTFIPGERRPEGESARARVLYLWGKYAGSFLSGDTQFVAQVNASMPAQVFRGVTIRRAIDMIAAQASSSAQWYVDQVGRLHFFTSETNAAPLDVTSDTPGAGEIAPHDLSIDFDAMSYANAVYVIGKNRNGTGWVYDHSEIARVGTVFPATINAPDCDDSTMRDNLGAMYLGRVTGSAQRGEFSASSPDDGWRAGQTFNLRSSEIGLDDTRRIVRVRTRLLASDTSKRRYTVEFGWSRRSAAAARRARVA